MADEVVKPLTGLPMDQLIGAPFMSASRAQAGLVATMLESIGQLAFGEPDAFLKGPETSAKDIITANMKLERPVQNQDGTIDTNTVTVAPLY